MEWMQALRQSIDYMEQHLLEQISITEIAAAVHISPFYFQRGFQIVTGYSVKEYLRNRRLYLAALDLLAKKEKVIDVAFRYGYETPESFAKAFIRFHGISPSQLRSHASQIRPFLPLKITISIQGGTDMDYTIQNMESFQLIGFSKTFSETDSYEKIPLFWAEFAQNCQQQKYSADWMAALLRYKIGQFGICIDTNRDGTFRYMIAGKYDGGAVPEGMELYPLPAFTWAVFRCVGPLPAALQTINTRIFKEWLPGNPRYELADGYSVEWYSNHPDMQSPDYESAIWIPVQEKATNLR